MNAQINLVDGALAQYIRQMGRAGIDPQGVRAKTLAALAGVSRWEMSNALQTYRLTPGTKYVVGSRGYGRASRWFILAKPGSDPQVVQQARAEQTRWAVEDAAQRWTTDLVHELQPGLQGTALDNAIASVLPFVTAQHTAVAAFVRQQLASTSTP